MIILCAFLSYIPSCIYYLYNQGCLYIPVLVFCLYGRSVPPSLMPPRITKKSSHNIRHGLYSSAMSGTRSI